MQRGDEDGRPRAQRREEATRGRGAAERMGQGPIEEEGGEGIGRRFFLAAQTRGTRSRWIGRMVGLGLKGAAGPRRKWAGLAATIVGSWWAEGEQGGLGELLSLSLSYIFLNRKELERRKERKG